ncbi:hypothetical protein [Sphingobacterium luzhongxinii]|uniref:hypothetical protein n=1 Tax=Sphingobacterium luzhongxinii TaxID=2654181 RepID=UPI0013D9921F|nr:hypothetical protein [Sphingobacterium sp. xlx-73]
MWVLTLVLLAGSSLNSSVNSSCPNTTTGQFVYQSHPESETGKSKGIIRPIPPVVRRANVEQENGTGGDKGTTRPPVKPLKIYSYLDQENGTGGDKGTTRPPVKPLKIYSYLDQENGTGGDKGTTRPPVKPLKMFSRMV